MKHRRIAWIAVAMAAGALATGAFADGHSTGSALTERMAALVGSLDDSQRRNASYDFDDAERFDLRLAPFGLEGLRFDALTADQQRTLESAFDAALSDSGMTKVETIRSLETEVAALEGGFVGFFMGLAGMRDPGRYFLALFGEPKPEEPWGFRFDGHHLSLNWTVVPGEPVSVTPLFLGGEPREVPSGLERAGLRVLADEEDRGVDLIAALTPDQRAASRLSFAEGSLTSRPLFVGEGEALADADTSVGVPVSSLSASAQAAVDRLVDAHLATFAAEVADRYRARFAAERDSLVFAWSALGDDDGAGAPSAGDPIYYRLQSRDLLIEFDDTVPEANHIHVVLRDRDNDFGRDLLAEHHRSDHAH